LHERLEQRERVGDCTGVACSSPSNVERERDRGRLKSLNGTTSSESDESAGLCVSKLSMRKCVAGVSGGVITTCLEQGKEETVLCGDSTGEEGREEGNKSIGEQDICGEWCRSFNLGEHCDKSLLVNKFEKAPIMLQPTEEEFTETNDSAHFVVCRQMEAKKDQEDSCRKALKHYLRSTKNEEGLLQTSVKYVKDGSLYFLYEVWQSKSFYDTHEQTSHYAEHLKLNATYLVKPEKVSNIHLPSSWWPQ